MSGFGFHLEHAEFDPFAWRDAAGRVHFEGQRPTEGRHRERVWPALSRYRRIRHKARWCSPQHARMNRSIEAASMLTVLRRWCPYNRLEAYHTNTCDHAQRPPRYDPW
jgi:hypothetical protein